MIVWYFPCRWTWFTFLPDTAACRPRWNTTTNPARSVAWRRLPLSANGLLRELAPIKVRLARFNPPIGVASYMGSYTTLNHPSRASRKTPIW
jgi:hypothetical protein